MSGDWNLTTSARGAPCPAVTAIVLNWNNAPDTMACLASLLRLEYPECRLLVVDNGSRDDSVTQIRLHFPSVPILELEENLGYTGGNNVGIEHALKNNCDYVWLLNDDVTVAPDALSALIDVALVEPQAGFLGPMVYMSEEPKRILSAGGRFCGGWQMQHRGISELDQGQFDAVAEVDCVSGCALLVGRETIAAVGALDEDFFAYYEDVEWCFRARQAGFKVLFVPQARAWHPDTWQRDADSPLVAYYLSRNQLLFVAKHYLGTGTLLCSLGIYLMRVVNWSIRPKWRHKRRQRDALLRAIVDFGRGRFGKAEWLAWT
jgi:GT2 family glycosyltransferase